MLGLDLVVTLAFMIFYARVADMERLSPVLVGGLSLVVSILAFYVLGWGFFAGVLAQGTIFVGMTVRNMLRAAPPA